MSIDKKNPKTEKNGKRPIIVLIDGYHLLHKGYYGSLKRKTVSTNRKGELVNAVYVFVAKINDMIESGLYHTVIVTFDVGKECWRRELYPGYKATRKETPSDLIPQMQIVRDFLTAANIPWYEKSSFEGDDVMGTIARIATKLGYDVEIVSNDKDCYQLVTDNVTVVSQKTAKCEREFIREEDVLESFGCKPCQIPDMKSLMGDQSDNIKGVKGLHFQTASKLLKEYGSIENVFRNIEVFPEEHKQKLLKYKDQILINKRIATIQKNVDLGRIDLSPLHVNYIRYLGFLRRERMWAFTKNIELKVEEQLKRRQEKLKRCNSGCAETRNSCCCKRVPTQNEKPSSPKN